MHETIQTLLLLAILYFLVRQQKTRVQNKKLGKKTILDTCALIDGRIIELSKAGFVPHTLIVPEFVIHELQMLADGSDTHKRERARYGLDVVKELQNSDSCELVIDRDPIADKTAVDDKLVALAKSIDAKLYTTDYNLNKVAEIENVQVLNVNELAGALRPIALPGERKDVKIVQKGNNNQQGVGYLEDGTMVVIDGAARFIGKTLSISVTRIHQTVAGKMLFGELIQSELPKTPAKTTTKRAPSSKATALRGRLRTH